MKRPNILFFLAIFCLFLSAWFSTSLCTDRFYFPESSSNIALGGPTSLGDGCYHIFLDVGANIGVHSRFLMEPQKYPNATNALKIFESVFGAPDHRDNRDFCLFAFEPNPLHKERFLNFTNAYNNVGWKIFFMAAGVSNKDGEMIFYHVGDGKHNECTYDLFVKLCSGLLLLVSQLLRLFQGDLQQPVKEIHVSRNRFLL